MEEKKYHIEESKIAGDKVCEPSPAYRSAASSALSVSSVSWDEAYDTDSYPMGRSLEQVMEHCESILDKLDDPNYAPRSSSQPFSPPSTMLQSRSRTGFWSGSVAARSWIDEREISMANFGNVQNLP